MKYLITGTLLILSLILLSGCSNSSSDDTALLDLYFKSWGNLNESETTMVFDFSLYNFGYKEAKNINIFCQASDEEDNVLFKFEEEIGNLASTSTKNYHLQYELETEKDLDNSFGYCLIKSCDDCEILATRIPELNEP